MIVAVNNTPVKSPEQLRELIGKAGKTVALLVQREDARIFIPVHDRLNLRWWSLPGRAFGPALFLAGVQ